MRTVKTWLYQGGPINLSSKTANNVLFREKILVNEFLGEFERIFAADVCLCPL